MPIPLQRSGTVSHGSSQGPGMSASGIQKDEYDQFNDVLMPDYIRANESEANAWMERKRIAHNEWQLSATPSSGTKPKFKQFFEEKERNFIKKRLFGGSGISRRRRRPSRKYKKSAKRVFRKKSRSTRRR
jgi:hypothetical protein